MESSNLPHAASMTGDCPWLKTEDTVTFLKNTMFLKSVLLSVCKQVWSIVTGHIHNMGKLGSKRLQAETCHCLVLHAPWAWGLDSVSMLVGSCSPSCITTSEHTTHYTSAT